MARTKVVWSDDFIEYDFGTGHPMRPLRLDLTTRLAAALGVLDDVEVVAPCCASDELLETVHDPEYVAAVKAAGQDPAHADFARGLGTDDDPAFLRMHEASARIVQGTVDMARAVWEGEAEHGVNYCGGLHHAMPDRASGFCVYNDIAVGIRWLLDHGAERVAYVDVDVHHGDGVERIFWDEPRVLTVSVHEHGRALFPGTGWPGDRGGPNAEGLAVNVALPPGTSDSAWLRAITSVALPTVRAFRPDVLVTQHGCDTHFDDPLAHLAVSIDAPKYAAETLHRLAHDAAGGKWVALGGGGYELVDVVPRSWTHLTAIAAHRPVDSSTPIPEEWRDHVERIVGQRGPARMGDLPPSSLPIWVQPWSMGYNPDSATDRAIMATREAVFPAFGLDPWFD
jgi:acetoin utilization protein AcuC